jgi:hypothetical protein
MTTPKSFNFDRDKPFYPLVTNYFAFLVGVQDLKYRRHSQAIKSMPEAEYEQALSKLQEPGRSEMAWLRQAELGNLIPQLYVPSKVLNSPVYLPSSLFEEEFRLYGAEVLRTTMRAAGSLLMLAHEMTMQWHDTRPLWEFLRHCRNAVAHNGRFHFRNGEPRRLAEWRGIRVESRLQNTPLFDEDPELGILGPADPIVLLADLELAYPQMKA